VFKLALARITVFYRAMIHRFTEHPAPEAVAMQTDNSPFDYIVRFSSDHDIRPSTHILHVCHGRLVEDRQLRQCTARLNSQRRE